MESVSFLPPAAARAKYLYETHKLLDKHRDADHVTLKDQHKRRGHVMHSSRLIHTLLRLEPRLIVRQSNFEEDWGLYIQRQDKLVFISQVSKGWMSEWSYIFVDEHDLLAHNRNPVHGWRTVLVRMMLKGVLAWPQVHAAFSNPRNQNTEKWLSLTEPFRNSHNTGLLTI